MIREFTFRNDFFNNELNLNLTSSSNFKELLNFAIIYGENKCGKSLLLDAFIFGKKILLNDNETSFDNHLLFGDYSYVFDIDDHIYHFRFSINKNGAFNETSIKYNNFVEDYHYNKLQLDDSVVSELNKIEKIHSDDILNYKIPNDKIIIIDNFGNGIHEYIICKFIENIKSLLEKGDIKNTQFIIATHKTVLMNHVNIDELWILDRINESINISELYSICEFKNIFNGDDIEKKYRAGKLGGVPII